MPRIKFLLNRDIYDHNKEIEASFEAGKVYNLNEAAANHWLRRGVAVEYVEPVKPKVTVRPKRKLEPEE